MMSPLRVIRSVFLVLVSCAFVSNAEQVEHVVIVSIDGLMPEAYTAPDKYDLQVPTLRQLSQQGCASPGAIGVFPTVTYPTHTSMVTGVLPARHGIYANRPLDPHGLTQGGWYYYAEQIQAPTLWDLARRAGLKTAAVSWPVTVGATVDYNIPEYRPIRTPDDLRLLRALSAPGLLSEFEREVGQWPVQPFSDWTRARAAAYILKRYKPNLLLLHIAEVDHEGHNHGPWSAEYRKATEMSDEILALLLKTAQEAGIQDRTAWVIVSDHGFFPVRYDFHPLAVLRAMGVNEYDSRGRLRQWNVWAYLAGGSFALVARDGADQKLINRVKTYFEFLARDPANGIAQVYSSEELAQLGAFPDAFLAAEMRSPYMVGSLEEGPFVTPSTRRGMHGYRPEHPQLRATFILYGAGISRCSEPLDARLVDVAPTVAALLDLPMSKVEGRAITEAFGSPETSASR